MWIRKLFLLLWKNWTLQKRHPLQTFFEIFAPVLICIILALARSLANTQPSAEIEYTEYNPISIYSSISNVSTISYSPTNPELTKLMLISFSPYLVNNIDSADLLEKHLIQDKDVYKVGVEFDDSLKNVNGRLPIKIDFTIRLPAKLQDGKLWPTDQLYPKWPTRGPRDPHDKYSPWPFYQRTGFLAIQSLLSIGIIKYHLNLTKFDQQILMQRFSYPEHLKDPFPPILDSFLAFIITLAYTYSVISITKVITVEKEKQLKESMKIMGLATWLHWTAWFIKSILLMLISITIIVIVLKTDVWYDAGIPAVFSYSNSFLLFLFLFLYACATITFCFMISVFFTNASLATTFVWLIFLLTLQPYMVTTHLANNPSLSVQLIISIFSNTAMGFGFNLILRSESMGEGMQWNNLWSNTIPTNNLMMGQILLMLLFDAILYMLITLYVEAVFPGQYGIPKKWNFMFTFCMSNKRRVTSNYSRTSNVNTFGFETDPEKLTAGIDIIDLRKEFFKNAVVKNLNLKMYENQITVLLGHNGAGKTTTICMLTGMYRPTKGTAIVNGYDIKTETDKARSSMGICPQYNVLFDDLTVREHIYFYGKLKGLKNNAVKKEVKDILQSLNFYDKKNKLSSTLSGGMKRKLSVAIAFTGNLKVVMLDEPTAGMDPSARRTLWEFIESRKTGRTILLTTHFMDEADLLGDRIAIMTDGKIICCGTSFFLKKKYGTGYKLVIAKNKYCNVEEVTNLLKSYFPNIKVETNVGTELTYLLRQEDSAIFEKVLKRLEDNSAKLGIDSYGISLTTLEDVFMKVGNQNQNNKTIDEKNTPMPTLLTGTKLLKNQFRAMFLKRIIISIRTWPLLLIQIVFCIFFLLSNLLIIHEFNKFTLPSLKLTLDLYEDSITIIKTRKLNQNSPKHYNFFETLKQILKDYKVHEVNNNSYLTDEIMKITRDDELLVKMYYIIGISIVEGQSLTGLFNSDPYHAPPIALNMIMNLILKVVDFDYEINVYNHPIPLQLEDSFDKECNKGTDIGMTISQCLSFMTACYILFYIKERSGRVKHLQLVSGMNVFIFWFVSVLWDWVTFLIFFLIFIIAIICFQEDGFKTFDDICRLILICLLFELAMFPMVYLFSLLYKLPATGFTIIIFFAIIGLFGFMMVIILDAINSKKVANDLDWLFLPLPTYSLPSGIANEHMEYCAHKMCQNFVDLCLTKIENEELCWRYVANMSNKCMQTTANYYTWKKHGMLPEIVFLLSVCLILFLLLFIIESGIFANCYIKRRPRDKNQSINIDEDVQKEKFLVNGLSDYEIKHYTLVLRNLSKYYKKHLAVNSICLAVDYFECFGLLGVNGAGKTTTFKMATGDIRNSSGDIYVNGMDLKKKRKEINKITGYCPQFDALFDELTPRETIKLFALIRGYEKKDCQNLSENMAIKFDFYLHLDKLVKNLSGGNKRKLSTAVSLIGDPNVVYLDEPTAGMDPAAKRHIWNQLCRERDSGKCLILTSHSMEECEALCTRVAIMVNGSFKCIGSNQHLKSRFAPGYTLTVKLLKSLNIDEDAEKLNNFVMKNFPSANLKQQYQELLTYNIPDSKLPWSRIFAIMEEAKLIYKIEDYSLGQSSLEQVFLTFAND